METKNFQGIFQWASSQSDKTQLEKYELLLAMDPDDHNFDQIVEEFFKDVISIIIYENFHFVDNKKFLKFYDKYFCRLENFQNFPKRIFLLDEMRKTNSPSLRKAKLSWCSLYFWLNIHDRTIEKNFWFYKQLSYRLFDNYTYFKNKCNYKFNDLFITIRDDFLKKIKSICNKSSSKNSPPRKNENDEADEAFVICKARPYRKRV